MFKHYEFQSDKLPLQKFFDLIRKFDNSKHRTAIDLPHNVLLFGAVLSAKPEHVLELGVGTGYATKSILLALSYNQTGKLTSVDSYKDFNGYEPAHFKELKDMGANIVNSSEEEFVCKQEANTFDMLVSDADHANSIKWLSTTVSLLKIGSPMFFHDTNYVESLKATASTLLSMGIQSHTFCKSTLQGERCERGWLLAFKV